MAYVDKEKFKRKLQYIFKTYRMSEIITEKVKHALDDTTVDVEEVVRCKDCKHRVNPSKMCAHPKAVGWDAIEPEDDYFCSYGKRKEK